MAVKLEFINVIVPISVIETKYPGGWEKCLSDHNAAIGGRVWFDEYLFRDGAMNPMDTGLIVERWAKLGLTPAIGDPQKWADLCVVEGLLGGPTAPCNWIEVAEDGSSASLKGAPSSPVIGRDNVRMPKPRGSKSEPARTAIDPPHRFPSEVADKLGIYVYRLIDPRNGQTFYVGKGQGDRVFQHARGVLPDEDRTSSTKLQRIKEIIASGFEVAHVIHRHGLDEKTALHVEAALIDALPGLTNLVGGHGSDECGVAHADEIIRRYSAAPFIPTHRILLISIANSVDDESRSNIYEATRFAWRLDPARARKADLVLAHRRGVVVGVFLAHEWLPATVTNFPGLTSEVASDRWGFNGIDAPEEARRQYLQRRVPEEFRRRGAANPIRFIEPVTGQT